MTICYAMSGAHDTVSDLFEQHCYKSDTFALTSLQNDSNVFNSRLSNNLQQAARKQLVNTL